MLKTLGNSIKQYRNNLKVSQEELGALSGLDRTYISGIERGIRNPSFTALVILAEALQLTMAELFYGIEEKMDENGK